MGEGYEQILQFIANYQPVLKEVSVGGDGDDMQKGQLLLVDRTIDPLIALVHSTSYQVDVDGGVDEQPMAMDLLAIGDGGEVGVVFMNC